MKPTVAIIGAGVSGLTCAVMFAERGYRTRIFAEQIGQRTTSAAAGAIWFPYDAEPADAVLDWALETYRLLFDSSADPLSGVSMIELRTFSRAGEIPIPNWAIALGAKRLPPSVITNKLSVIPSAVEESRLFASGFTMTVPLMDTPIYLDYLAERLTSAGGSITGGVRFDKLDDVNRDYDLVVNCAGIGARTLVPDLDLEPHRGQIVLVPKFDLPCAIVCDDPPLMYAFPRSVDCVLGGTNDLSDDLAPRAEQTVSILAECSRVLKIDPPKVLSERVGLRPFRKSGVRLEREQLRDSRIVIHNYGHGGSGFALSWGCAKAVLKLALLTQ